MYNYDLQQSISVQNLGFLNVFKSRSEEFSDRFSYF